MNKMEISGELIYHQARRENRPSVLARSRLQLSLMYFLCSGKAIERRHGVSPGEALQCSMRAKELKIGYNIYLFRVLTQLWKALSNERSRIKSVCYSF